MPSVRTRDAEVRRIEDVDPTVLVAVLVPSQRCYDDDPTGLLAWHMGIVEPEGPATGGNVPDELVCRVGDLDSQQWVSTGCRRWPPPLPALADDPLAGVVTGEVNSGDDVNWIAEVTLDTPLEPGGIREVSLRFSQFEPCEGWTPMSNPINIGDRFTARAILAEWVGGMWEKRVWVLQVAVDSLAVTCG